MLIQSKFQVSPLLEVAVKALDSIKKEDIQEIKSYKKPPELVIFVMEPFCILFDREVGWDSASFLLQEMDLLTNMSNLKKDRIKNKTLKQIKTYLDDPRFVILLYLSILTFSILQKVYVLFL